MTLHVPAGLRASLARVRDPTSGPWLDGLPALATEFLETWQLRIDGPAMHGVCAIVLPVRTPAGTRAALKLTWPHDEARDEYRALAQWDGNGAVRLLRAEPDEYVVLLERLHPERDLSAVPLGDALRSIGGLLRRLNVPAPDGFVELGDRAREWSAEFAEALRQPPPGVPRRVLEHAAGLLPDLLATTEPVLLHTDLHYENVLGADREPWLAIDPKPLVGDAAYEIAPLLWNRWSEATSADLDAHLQWRADVTAEAADLDRARVAGWIVVRETVEVLDAVADGDAEWRDLSAAVAEAFLSRLP